MNTMKTTELKKRYESAEFLAAWRKEILWRENMDRTYASLDVIVCGKPDDQLDTQPFVFDDGVAAATLQLVAEAIGDDGCVRLDLSSVTWKQGHDDVLGTKIELRGSFDLVYPDVNGYAFELLKGED